MDNSMMSSDANDMILESDVGREAGPDGELPSREGTPWNGVMLESDVCRVAGLNGGSPVQFGGTPVKVEVEYCVDTSLVVPASAVALEVNECVRCRMVVGAIGCTVKVQASDLCVVELTGAFKVLSSSCLGLALVSAGEVYSVPFTSTLAVSTRASGSWRTQPSTAQPTVVSGDEVDAARLAEIVKPESTSQTSLPCFVSPDLFLGDARSVSDPARLKRMGVTHVLNLAAHETPRIDYEAAGIRYHGISALDAPGYDVLQHFDEARAFYEDARVTKPRGKLVIHSVAGVNRSGAIAVALYVVVTGTPILRAAAHVHACRGSFLWNESFRLALLQWANAQGGAGRWIVMPR